jgi:hypothetical protein
LNNSTQQQRSRLLACYWANLPQGPSPRLRRPTAANPCWRSSQWSVQETKRKLKQGKRALGHGKPKKNGWDRAGDVRSPAASWKLEEIAGVEEEGRTAWRGSRRRSGAEEVLAAARVGPGRCVVESWQAVDWSPDYLHSPRFCTCTVGL